MRIRVGDHGEWYEFDPGKLLVREARLLEELTGMGLQDFSDGMKHGRVNALVFMLFLARRRAGEAVQWRDFDELNIAELRIEDDEDEGAGDGGGDAEGDPLAGAVAAAPAKVPAGAVNGTKPRKARTRR